MEGASRWLGKNGSARVALSELARVAAFKRDVGPDFRVQHFYEKACELHGLTLSYTRTLGICRPQASRRSWPHAGPTAAVGRHARCGGCCFTVS